MSEKKLYYVAICQLINTSIANDEQQQEQKELQILHKHHQHDHYILDNGQSPEKFERYTQYKLKSVPEGNFCSFFDAASLGAWYVKGYRGHIYVVATSPDYDNYVAVECLDELCQTFQNACSTWGGKRRNGAKEICCPLISQKYASFDEKGGAPDTLVTEIDENVRLEYSKSVRELFEKVDQAKDQMHENILQQLQNIESAEALQAKSDEAMEAAKIFKKKAKKLKTKMRLANAKTVAAVAALGGVVGFLAGGPFGAGMLTSMSSVAAAQAVEAGIGATVFVIGFVGAESAMNSWTVNQRFVKL